MYNLKISRTFIDLLLFITSYYKDNILIYNNKISIKNDTLGICTDFSSDDFSVFNENGDKEESFSLALVDCREIVQLINKFAQIPNIEIDDS